MKRSHKASEPSLHKKKPHFGSLPASVINRWKKLRRTLSVDFEGPLSTGDQWMVMLVILTISCVLFSAVYLAASVFRSPPESVPVQTSVREQEEPSTEVSRKENSVVSQPSGTDVSEETSAPSLPSEETASSQEPSESSAASSGSGGETISGLSPGDVTYQTIGVVNENVHYGKLILINKDCLSVYDGENVREMINIKSDTYYLANAAVSLDQDIIGNVDRMMNDFYALYGASDIMLACGYRSYQEQAVLYRDELEAKGEEGEKWVAPPGFSEHQTGLAFDLNLHVEDGVGGIRYDGMGNYAWFNRNCQNYGFIIRYPEGKEAVTGYEFEPWHFRYVGVPAAVYMTRHGMVLEEFLDEMETHTAASPLVIEQGTRRWMMYYVPRTYLYETEVPVPVNVPYELSGNNYNGYLVTAELSGRTETSSAPDSSADI